MTVAIISGRGGTGKTSQLITLARLFSPARWAIMKPEMVVLFKDEEEQ